MSEILLVTAVWNVHQSGPFPNSDRVGSRVVDPRYKIVGAVGSGNVK